MKSESASGGDSRTVTPASDTAFKLPQPPESVNHLTRSDAAWYEHGVETAASGRAGISRGGHRGSCCPVTLPGVLPFSAGPTRAGDSLGDGDELVVGLEKGGSAWTGRCDTNPQQQHSAGTGDAVGLRYGPCRDTGGDTSAHAGGCLPLPVPVGQCAECAGCALSRRILVSIFMFCFNFKPQEGY